jgi:hypothetical protein
MRTPMNKTLRITGLTVLLALLPAGLSAQPKNAKTRAGTEEWQRESTKLPKRPPAATSCAQYGAGFVRLPGSDACIRMGGGLDVGVGVRSGENR